MHLQIVSNLITLTLVLMTKVHSRALPEMVEAEVIHLLARQAASPASTSSTTSTTSATKLPAAAASPVIKAALVVTSAPAGLQAICNGNVYRTPDVWNQYNIDGWLANAYAKTTHVAKY